MKVLQKHRRRSPFVLDPFCGRGTTLYAARNLQLSAQGIDTSPVAVAIARAKLAKCDIEEPLELAEQAIRETDPKDIPDSQFFRSAYHPQTLRDICALREYLLHSKSDDDVSSVLRAAVLGCLHGPRPKHDENAGYFSNQMPRTYASKPDYAVRYWQRNDLKPSKIDILRVLRRKIERLTGLIQESPSSPASVIHGDAQDPNNFRRIGDSPLIVVTSPPYYGMRTYVQDQWLRNWFLGGSSHVDYSAGPQVSHGGQDAFSQSLGRVWENAWNSGTGDIHMHVRIGVIPSVTVDPKRLFRESLVASGKPWREVSVRRANTADAGKRQAAQMKTKSSAAVEFDFHVERS